MKNQALVSVFVGVAACLTTGLQAEDQRSELVAGDEVAAGDVLQLSRVDFPYTNDVPRVRPLVLIVTERHPNGFHGLIPQEPEHKYGESPAQAELSWEVVAHNEGGTAVFSIFRFNTELGEFPTDVPSESVRFDGDAVSPASLTADYQERATTFAPDPLVRLSRKSADETARIVAKHDRAVERARVVVPEIRTALARLAEGGLKASMSGPFDDGEVEVSWSDSVFHRSGRIENRNADYDRSFQQLGTLECPVSIIVSCSQSPDDLRGLSHIDVISELWVDIRKNEPDAPYTVTDQLDGVTVHKIWFAGDFRSSLPGLTRVKDLHTLELSQRGHLDYDSDSFSPLQHLSDLQYLDLFIDDLSSARIPLGGLSSLKGLRINAKALSSRSLLLDGATSIESMHLCSRELQACFRSLGKAVGLKELSLQLGRLNHTGIAAINSLPHLEHLKLHDCLTPAQLTQITNPSLLTISAELSGDSRSPLTTERLLAWDYPANASLDISNCDVWTPRGLQHFVKDLPDMTQEERALYRACESTRAIISEHETRIRNFRVFQEERGLDYSDRYLASALKECEDLCRKVLNATSNLYTLRRIQLNNALAIQNGFYRYCGGRIILEEELTARQTAGLQKDRRNWRRYVDTQRNSWQ